MSTSPVYLLLYRCQQFWKCFLKILILFMLIRWRGPRNFIDPASKPQIPAVLYYPEGIKILHQNELMFWLCKHGPFTLNQLHLSECWIHLLITRIKFFMLLSVFPTSSLVNFYFGHLSPCLFLLWFFKTWCFSDFPSFLVIYAPLDWSDRFF